MLRRRVGRSGASAAQAGHEGRDDPVSPIGARDLHLNLPEACRHAPAIAHGDLVVHDLGDPRPAPVDQPHAATHRRQPRHRHELGLPHIGAHHLQRRLRRLRAALEGQLLPCEDCRVGLAGRRGRLGELEGPTLAGPPAQRNAPPGQAQVGRVEVDRFHAHRLGRPDLDSRDDSGEVREVKRGARPELHLTLDHRGPRESKPQARDSWGLGIR